MGDTDTVSSADYSNIASFFVGSSVDFNCPNERSDDLGLLSSSPILASSPPFPSVADYCNEEELDRDNVNTARYFVDITLQNFVKPESLGARVSSVTKALQGYGAWTPPRAVSRRPRVQEVELGQSYSSQPIESSENEKPAEFEMPQGRASESLANASVENMTKKPISGAISVEQRQSNPSLEHTLATACRARAPLSSVKGGNDRGNESDMEASRARECRRAAISRLRFKKASRRFGQTRAIRYQSRKRIAEVRPRVNGRFVRLNSDVSSQ
jgi:hypothetical protein